MTDHDRPTFAQAFNKLAVAFREQVDQPKLRVYFEALSSLSVIAVESAARLWMLRGGDRFPTTSQWYELAVAAEQKRRDSQRTRELPPAETPELAQARRAFLEQLKHGGTPKVMR